MSPDFFHLPSALRVELVLDLMKFVCYSWCVIFIIIIIIIILTLPNVLINITIIITSIASPVTNKHITNFNSGIRRKWKGKGLLGVF